LSPLTFIANSGHEGRGYTDTEKIDSRGSTTRHRRAARTLRWQSAGQCLAVVSYSLNVSCLSARWCRQRRPEQIACARCASTRASRLVICGWSNRWHEHSKSQTS